MTSLTKQDINTKTSSSNTTPPPAPQQNIASTQQMGKVFQSLYLESPDKTAKGQDSWNEAALVNINHRVAGLIRQHRTLEKLNSTYIEPYLETDVMHTSFCNWGTLTGRLSSRNPNLQNIPRTHFKLKDTHLSLGYFGLLGILFLTTYSYALAVVAANARLIISTNFFINTASKAIF